MIIDLRKIKRKTHYTGQHIRRERSLNRCPALNILLSTYVNKHSSHSEKKGKKTVLAFFKRENLTLSYHFKTCFHNFLLLCTFTLFLPINRISSCAFVLVFQQVMCSACFSIQSSGLFACVEQQVWLRSSRLQMKTGDLSHLSAQQMLQQAIPEFGLKLLPPFIFRLTH